MDDLIKREDAIRAIDKIAYLSHSVQCHHYASLFKNDIWHIPSADSVAHGEWVHYIDDFGLNTTKCSVCNIDFNTSDGYGWNYCPYCGAKMSE